MSDNELRGYSGRLRRIVRSDVTGAGLKAMKAAEFAELSRAVLRELRRREAEAEREVAAERHEAEKRQ